VDIHHFWVKDLRNEKIAYTWCLKRNCRGNRAWKKYRNSNYHAAPAPVCFLIYEMGTRIHTMVG
jgi:hypothetical protein